MPTSGTPDLTVHYEALDRVVAFANGKGGVGKTAMAGNALLEAARMGLNVCAIDLDSQGNLSEELGLSGGADDDDGAALAAALEGRAALVPKPTGRENASIIYGGPQLRACERRLTITSAQRQDGSFDTDHNNGRSYLALSKPLAEIAEAFDLVIVDCPPGSETLLQVGLGASRYVVVPAREDESSRKGLSLIARDLNRAQDAGAMVDPLAVVLFGSLANATSKRKVALESLSRDLDGGVPVLQETVRSSTQATTARYLGLSIRELNEAAASLPQYHVLKRIGVDSVDPPLPDTPRVGQVRTMTDRDTNKSVLIPLLRGVTGNISRLADDYAAVTARIFSLIEEQESQEAIEQVKAGI